MCSSRKYPFSPHRRDLNFRGGQGGGWRFSKTKNFKECIKFNWNFQRGGGSWKKSLLWGRYGYFLELHNVAKLLIEFYYIELGINTKHCKVKIYLFAYEFCFWMQY